VVGPSKLEDKDVGPDVGTNDEFVEIGPETEELRFATEVGGGGVITAAMLVGTSVGVEIVEVDDVGEIPMLETAEPPVDVGEVTEGTVLLGDESVLRV
jgi:hypothetical protein